MPIKVSRINTLATVAIPTVTAWASYTPTFSAGFGTVSNVNIEWRRNGENLELQGYWTNGTVAASIATMSLPPTLTVAASVTNQRPAGLVVSSAGTILRDVLIVASGSIIEFANTNTTSFVPKNVSTIFNNGENNSFIGVSIPITGWTAATNNALLGI